MISLSVSDHDLFVPQPPPTGGSLTEGWVVKKYSRGDRTISKLPLSDGIARTDKNAFQDIFAQNFITREIDEQQAQRLALARVVKKIENFGMSARVENPMKITSDTSAASIKFIGELPKFAQLPKVAPDGEGRLMLSWEADENNPLLLIIEDWKMHLVTGAGTENADCISDLRFDGETIPEAVVAAIPAQA